MRKPYVILIGSASGIGKSTVAAELAKELNIKHLLESDFIRAVVRGIIGSDYAPALHESSYNAYKTLRDSQNYETYDELVAAGFEEHASFVIPALEKVIKRAINDYDDVVLEGVHLIPGSINLEQFKEQANVHFFILSADEESHKSRFVKRAVQIHRGGKQLDYFTENRIIHNYLVDKAERNNIDVIDTENMETTLKKMLMHINRTCEIVLLKNDVDDIKKLIEIVMKDNNGVLEKISYKIEGFKDPLVRNINLSDYKEAQKFVETLDNNPDKKNELQKMYNLSKYRSTTICAGNRETLDKIISELRENNFVYNE
ncbi:3H domain-containing protein [Methanobrevibacter sp. DSM 116169]|uniref:3H domain-containing protein n=1 Tax=Methanobrevibacter sp. DSM 116169 TaxID=3242727 RepID=UPI0038FC47B6